MKTTDPDTIDYDELLRDQGPNLDKIAQFKEYCRLRDIARNLESQRKLLDAEAKEREEEPPGDTGDEG